MRRAVLSVILLFGLTGCSQNDLSRGRASGLIAASPKFSEAVSTLQYHESGKAMWEAHGGLNTRELVQAFAAASPQLTLVNPTHRTVETVTGIANFPLGEGVKEAQFTWRYDPLPRVAARYAVVSGTGKALFRQFDDGWRLENLDLEEKKTTPNFSAAEQAENQKMVDAELERRKMASQAKQKRIAELELILAESRVIHREILTSQFVWDGPYNKSFGEPGAIVKVQDAGLSYQNWKRSFFVSYDQMKPMLIGEYTANSDGWGPDLNIWLENYWTRMGFRNLSERDAFVHAVSSASDAWNAKYGAASRELAGLR